MSVLEVIDWWVGTWIPTPGVAMSFNMEAYRDTKSLFEASHEGIIQGVPFAGTVSVEDVDDLIVGGQSDPQSLVNAYQF